jgi:glycosyltransferase involved in cell wall biosynthesis
MNISVVVPLYNEVESLPELTSWITKVMDENRLTYEIMLIDDGSNDGSWDMIKRLQTNNPFIKGIKFRRNYGKSDEIPELYRRIIEEKYDLVSGWKAKRYDPISKTIPTKLYNAATRRMSGIKNLHDFNCGLKAYRKAVVKNIEVYGEMHRYIPVIAKWAGFIKIGEQVVEIRQNQVRYEPLYYRFARFGFDFLCR